MQPPTVRVIRPPDRAAPADQTPGMYREEVESTDGFWLGTVKTEPGLVTGWHHHGDYESYIYVLAGRIRLEFGPGGRLAEEAGPGDFIHIPGNLVHREGSSTGSQGVEGIVIRAGGRGPVLYNVEGPEGE